MSSMRTGADYRESLRDGRRVFVLGEGLVEDVTTHPATQAMVEEYVAWYDRHFEPEWQDTLLTPPDKDGKRSPVGYMVPRSPQDLARMGRCFSATTFLSAGNITHTPAYGHLIAMGVQTVVNQRNASPEQRANAEAYRALIARTGRFLTFAAGAATIGYRLREDPAERAALKIVKETDKGLVISGKIGMHTSPAYAARRLYRCPQRRGPQRPSRHLRRRRSTRPASPWSAASPRRAMATRSPPRSARASTSSTARCGSTTC